MNTKITNILFIIGLVGLLSSSCNDSSYEGKIIITKIDGELKAPDFFSGKSWRYIPGAQIALLDPEKGEIIELLTSDFVSAQSPSLSFDGKNMLFAGQKNENEPWQIWEMELANQKYKQLTFSDENCTDPVYLPNGYFIYSKLASNDSLKAGHSLYSSNLNSEENKRITFNPSTYFASNVLKDGKLITVSSQIYPDKNEPMYFSILPDGTKAEIFYKGNPGSHLISKVREGLGGQILFIESPKGNTKGGKLIAIDYNRPLHTRKDLASSISGNFISVCTDKTGNILVGYRKTVGEKYGLYQFNMNDKKPGKAIYTSKEFNIIDAIVCETRTRPKKLPSAVKENAETGQLLCQDINVIDAQFSDSVKATMIEVIGLDSTLAIVPVEADGSFYLKIQADMPFKIKTLDVEGNIVHGSSDWMWLRPNERRGCVGCHADPELAPENRLSLAVRKSPVTIPALIGTEAMVK
jgi:hypothetical protein